MAIPRNFSKLADNVDANGILQVSGGGTGLSSAVQVTQQRYTYTAPTGTYSRGPSLTSATYTRSAGSNVVTITRANTFVAGDRIYVAYISGTAVSSWQTVITANATTITIASDATSATSGSVNIYPYILITINNHGFVNGNSAYLSYSANFSAGSSTVYQATANTFQVQDGVTTQQLNSSGTVTCSNSPIFQTWTKPTGCKSVLVELCGGGGQTISASSIGAGGGYSRKMIDVTSVSSVNLYVGFAGKLDTYGGGSSSFGSYLSATGGQGSVAGTGSNGTLNMNGGPASSLFNGSYLSYGSAGYGYGGSADTDNAGTGVVFVTEYY
jgi:hypothetical protein